MTEQEFAYLSDRIRGRLTTLARRFNRASGMDEEAEDIVQDALVTLWQLSEKGYPVRDVEALAVKLTKTRCVERSTAMWETWVQSLGREDPLEKGKATHFSILACQ